MLDRLSGATPYPSRRSPTYARRGMVSTTQPLAAQVGRDILSRGGNAVDAAVATAAALTVVEPTSNGLGGDAFALVWIADGADRGLHGLDGSGKAPRGLSLDSVRKLGHEQMPLRGWLPVMVPGCPAAWAELSRRFGKLPFADLLAPAIALAEQGFPVSPTIAEQWRRGVTQITDALAAAPLPETDHFLSMFAPEGQVPRAGELWRSTDLARTLEALATTQCESFYRGELARQMDDFSRQTGGGLGGDDLAHYQAEWVTPISTRYRGFDVWELPPNGQGVVVLMALNLMEGFDVDHRDNPDVLHHQLEAMKLAYCDGMAHITQPSDMRTRVEDLLSLTYADQRRTLIGERALAPFPGTPASGGTVYLATADADGNMVSFIQSNYHDFGAAVVVPDTGILLQNRGSAFSLDPQHVNVLAPGKKTFHTIIPGFLTQAGQPLGPFGVMGAFMQPQGQMQAVMNMVDFALNPQAALDAPRWQWFGGRRVGLEAGYGAHLANAMAARGHEVFLDHDRIPYGRGQIILRDPHSGVLCGGCEPRADAAIAVL
ncbi:gamma-glutamyltransferase family protein [Halomonas sp.]|uniref:gamma-glutamyltransferase family protein n=1 Tax=Halomonas sp. TaxID=1486246 RepID=UPI0025BDB628|nr:gamma-glutamyltransferase family protein [Halomonas sp.]